MQSMSERRAGFVALVFALALAAPVMGGALRAQESANLRTAVEAYAKAHGDVGAPSYSQSLIDLDGDGRLDAVVMLHGAKWCGAHGCQLLALRGTPNGFTVVSSTSNTSGPVRVATNTANGWRSLIVSSNGSGDFVLRNGGSGYPSDASSQPRATPNELRGVRTLIK